MFHPTPPLNQLWHPSEPPLSPPTHQTSITFHQLPSSLPAASQQPPSSLSAASQQSPSSLPAASQQLANRSPAASQKPPNSLPIAPQLTERKCPPQARCDPTCFEHHPNLLRKMPTTGSMWANMVWASSLDPAAVTAVRFVKKCCNFYQWKTCVAPNH